MPNSRDYNDRLSRIKKRAGALAKSHGLAEGYRSGLEVKVGVMLTEMDVPFEFEDDNEIIEWTPLPTKHKYHPDFVLKKKNGRKLIIETKGRFMPEDMHKHLAIQLQNPGVDIHFVFQNPRAWYRKAQRMSYAIWCEKHGFTYCGFKEFTPERLREWLND